MVCNRVDRQIAWGDLDPLGIVFYPRYYEWMDASGHLFFDGIGLNLSRLAEERRLLFGLVDTSCRFLRPGRYHQRLHIDTELVALGEKTVELRHRFVDASENGLLAEGRERRICLDISDLRRLQAVTIAPDLRTVLERAQAPGGG
jgi:YbgC/YbaW family acyl-CoA thioester hydrolase